MAVAQDSISQFLTAAAAFVTVLLSTFETSALVLFPIVLLITGIVLQFFLLRRIEVVDSVSESAPNIALYTTVALAGIAVGGLLPSFGRFLIPSNVIGMQMTDFQFMLYGVLMAVAEEQFFRGALMNAFLNAFNPIVAVMLSGGVFAIYHLAIYGTSVNAVLYVLTGGMVLSFVAYRSQRLSPTMLAHLVANVFAYSR